MQCSEEITATGLDLAGITDTAQPESALGPRLVPVVVMVVQTNSNWMKRFIEHSNLPT